MGRMRSEKQRQALAAENERRRAEAAPNVAQIMARHTAGDSTTAIAQDLGLSRQRVWRIITTHRA